MDSDYDNWHVGDWVIWADEKDGPRMQIVEIDEYQRVFWLVGGRQEMTRATNLLRVQEEVMANG